MPRPKQYGTTREYYEISAHSEAAGERNDCVVRAIALACNVDYLVALQACRRRGRIPGQGMYPRDYHLAIRDLGYKVRAVDPQYFICRYPGAYHKCKNVTTHHPDRFAKSGVFKDGKNYLFSQRGHVTCVIDGVNHDWTRGKARIVHDIVEIYK